VQPEARRISWRGPRVNRNNKVIDIRIAFKEYFEVPHTSSSHLKHLLLIRHITVTYVSIREDLVNSYSIYLILRLHSLVLWTFSAFLMNSNII
jgi:hypothetical protein